MSSDAAVYTIGHSTHPIDEFIALLNKTCIDAIADVRSAPYSRWQPQFNRETLRKSLADNRIAYVFLGREIGGRGIDDSVRDEHGRVQYHKIAESTAFHDGLRRVRSGSKRMRIALMCTESEPLECHRSILISRILITQETPVIHIRADGSLEEHRDAEHRLLRLTGLHEPDLFRTQEERLAEAYKRQEKRIAYMMPYSLSESGGRNESIHDRIHKEISIEVL